MACHCPRCGKPLIPTGEFHRYWITAYTCPTPGCPDYLEVADMRNAYPLLELQTGIRRKLLAAPEEVIRQAVERIRRIDSKTVSIVDFERCLAAYRPGDIAGVGDSP